MSNFLRPVTGIVFLSLLFSSFSASRADDTAEQALSPVIVTANRIPTPEEQVGSSVTLITAQDIEAKQERTLPEVLQDVPGLEVVQSGGPGEITSVFMRGTNSNQVKVLIDGIDAGDPSSINGAFDFSQILASDIERVEVLRGPQSGLYGSDAIGGVINIITKSGSGPAQFTGSAEVGSFQTFNQTAGVSGGLDRFNYNVNAAHYYTGAMPVTPDNLVPSGRVNNPDVYDNQSLSTKLGANLADNVDVGLVGHYIVNQLYSTSDDATGPESLNTRSTNHELFSRGTAHWSLFDGTFDQTAGLGYTQYRRVSVDPFPTTYSPFGLFGGDRIKGDWQGNVKVAEGETVTLGAERQLDSVSDPGQVNAAMGNNAGFTQLQSALGKRLFNTISLRDDDNSRFGNKVTYREAPAFLITETGTKLKASYGTGFKAPTLDELYDNYPAYGISANPDLKPESSKGYDVGFEQSLFRKKVLFGSTYFHNDIKNLITLNDSYTMDVNVGRATTRGFENFISYAPWKTLTLRADYTFTLAENDITSQELQRRPKNKASLSATWQATDRLSFAATELYNGSWIDGNRAGTESGIVASNYAVTNITSSYLLGNGLTAFGRIDNLLDKHYQEPIGFEHPGFGIFGGLKFSVDTGKESAKTSEPHA